MFVGLLATSACFYTRPGMVAGACNEVCIDPHEDQGLDFARETTWTSREATFGRKNFRDKPLVLYASSPPGLSASQGINLGSRCIDMTRGSAAINQHRSSRDEINPNKKQAHSFKTRHTLFSTRSQKRNDREGSQCSASLLLGRNSKRAAAEAGVRTRRTAGLPRRKAA